MIAVNSLVLATALVASCAAQQLTAQAPVAPSTGPLAQPHVAAAAAVAPVIPKAERASYLLGADDQISIHALDAEELNDKPMRIDMSGYIRLPMVGRIQAAGLTVEQFENELGSRLRKYIKDPEVSVNVLEFHSQPISIIGAVKIPGVYQLQGRKTLVECLSLAGGPADDAGYSVKITRRIEWGPLPLPSAVTDPTGRFSVAQLDLASIIAAKKPEENIPILPQDVISVPSGQMVYVLGTVPRAGGYVMHEHETISVLQVLALAGGTDRFAIPQKARIMRPVAGNGNRTEIPVNLKAVMAGQAKDVALQADDILFVPSSKGKAALARGTEAVLGMAGYAIYRF
jgi:polysaccharide export outer membrane protein